MLTKRAYLIKKGEFEIREIDLNPKSDEVLIKVAICGLCNWELNFWHGGEGMFSEYPAVLGHEWSGEIVKVGCDVKSLKVGDRVTACDFGGFGEYNVVKESACQKIADGVKYENAMGEPIKCISTVLTGINPKFGDIGVVLGCGAMGLWCTQCISGGFLSQVIAIDIDDKKLELAKKCGATHTINSLKENAVEKIKEITGGCMADFVIEGTGVPGVLNQASGYLKDKGRIIIMSSHERAVNEFNFSPIFYGGISIIGAGPNLSSDPDEDLRRGVSLINNGTINNDLIISHRFPLDNINEAFKSLDHKPKDYIKGIVVCNPDMLK